LVRLPLPVAQLYSRAFNAKDARARHDNAFYLFEALVKLAAAPAVACYLREVEAGGARVAAIDRLLAQLVLPSLGQWVAMLRELSRQFGSRTDAATHPLGSAWKQLMTPRRDLSGIVSLFRRIKNGPDGQPSGDQFCTLLELFEALVQYRNGVFGHGAARFDSFYDQQMGPLLFPAINELLSPRVFDWAGSHRARFVYISEVRRLADGRFQIDLRELVGLESERLDPYEVDSAEAAALLPGKVAVLWPGRPIPLPLDPLLQYRETDLSEEVLFLNRDRNGRHVEYLSYTTGRTERDRSTVAGLTALLSRVTNTAVEESDLDRLATQALAEAPSGEGLPGEAGAATAVKRPEGDFEILAEIGRGGMGVVYLARQLSLGQLVALKVLPGELAGDEIALARFKREIRHLARCEHPNIIKVFSSGVLPDGQMYYTMEYVPGSDLEMIWRELAGPHRHGAADSLSNLTWARSVLTASRKRRDKAERTPAATNSSGAKNAPAADAAKLLLPSLPETATADDRPGGYVRQIATIIRDAALALQAVHEQGIVHRDVKPGNLVLTPDSSRIVLMDFGLAKGQSIAASISHAGGFLGTLRYAAPEQLAAATLKVGPTADIRGLGATMWELLTRERLFADAEDEAQLAYRIHEEDVPPLRSIDPSLDRDLEAIVARATERRVADRIQSAALMADYLQLYLDGKPLPIRPAGIVERTVRWARTRKEIVAALVLSIVALFAVGVWSIVQMRQQEAASLVHTLLDADLETVPSVVNDLGRHWTLAQPLLREQFAAAADESKEKLNLSLALLPHDSTQVDYLLHRMLEATPSQLRVLRTALEPQAKQLAPKLWTILDADNSGQYLRAACALADYDPQNARWAVAGTRVAGYLVAENVLLVGQWQEMLRPVQKALVPPLAMIFSDRDHVAGQRELAIALLTDYAADDPDTLARVIVEASPQQYASLFPLLAKHRQRIVELMTRKLAEVARPDWKDPQLNPAWTQPDAAIAKEIEAANGLLAERFALCHGLPLARFTAVADGLRASGYRPINFRPYAAGAQTFVAAVWTRDGEGWHCALDLTADELRIQVANWRQHGFLPLDVACYAGSQAGDSAEPRYAALWAPSAPDVLAAELAVGVSGDDDFKQLRATREQAGFYPRTLVRMERNNGQTPLYCAVWRKPRQPIDRDSLVYDCGQDHNWYDCKQSPSRVQEDVQLSIGAVDRSSQEALIDSVSAGGGELQFSAVWRESPRVISADVFERLPNHVAIICRQLAAEAYRPVAVSAVVTGLRSQAFASVWHIPAVPDATTESLATEEAIAAATLLRLNETESVWPLFRHTPDPRLRTDLIHLLGPLGAAPEPLVDQLAMETDVSARRALILCLGEFTDKQFHSDVSRKQLVDTLERLFGDDPDPGIHAAAEWVLRRWGYDGDVRRISGDPALLAAGTRGWYTTEHGYTMAVIPGPVEFMMGSPGTETDRYKQEETMHLERIPRSFAIATKKVTVAQFKEFEPKFSYPAKYSSAADGPIVSVTWFDAVRYCQWLSEQEKIPPDQWCYPPEKEIKEGMRLPDKYLSRTGYRLPTEAEWEYACRAGAATSRNFGQSREMLNNYAWTFHNSAEGDLGEHAWPVGRLKPNDFGLFDIHGNVWEWCEDRYLPYRESPRIEAVEDTEDSEPQILDTEADRRVLRGGSFLNRAPIVRSAARNRYRASTANYYVGLRVVRTVAP
jgi:formylglycine-generating enzyme required for sulfatase activity/serine/threonine protein kinase